VTTTGDHTAATSIRLAGGSTLTGARATVGYRRDAEQLLLDRAPLPAASQEPLHDWIEKFAGTPPTDLLEELHHGFGFEWQRIAELLMVSVPALTKWRAGGGLSHQSDVALRRLRAFCELAVRSGIGDVRSWMAAVPVAGAPLSRADLFTAGADQILLDAGQSALPVDVLDQWIPRWRDKARVSDAPLHPVVNFDTNGAVILRVTELPAVVGVGNSLPEAGEMLVDSLRDYAADWDDRLHLAPNHAENEAVVRAIQASSDEELIGYLVGDD